MKKHYLIKSENLTAFTERRPISRRYFLAAMATLPLATLPESLRAQHLSEPNVHAVARLWPSQEYTRLVIETQHELVYNFMRLENPARLVFDFQHGRQLQELATLSLQVHDDDPYIANIRLGDRPQDVLRLVVDLKAEVDPQVFVLKPVANFGYRLVIDIYPKVLFDPLMMLVREFEQDDNVQALEAKYADDDALLLLVKQYEQQTEQTAALPPASPLKTTPKTPENPIIATAPPPTTEPLSEHLPEAAPPPTATKPIRDAKTPIVRPVIVMIDPGHGGEDPGAIGKRGTQEKAVVLAIAKHIKKLIDKTPNMRAVMTRDGDYFVPLRQRVEKARRVKADLFVSVHADAFTKSSAKGSSVFALSAKGATSEAARWLAQKENDADLIGGVNLNVKDTSLAKTLLDMSQAAQIKDSLVVGSRILAQLSTHNALHKGKVEQAGFAVLKAPDIPSVLVETAFISNPEEENKLRSATHQQRYAKSIVDGIVEYFKS